MVIVDWVMKKATSKRRGIIWKVFNCLEDLDFADDLCLISHKTEHLQAKTDDMVKEGKKVGLVVNVGKTNTMSINGRPANININNEEVKNVDKFTYLGSVITTDGGAEADVRARVAKASHAFSTLTKVWKSKNISRNTKLRIFNSNVKAVLLYGAETWLTNRTVINKLQVFVNKCLRRILGIFWPERITNEELWSQTKQESIEMTVRRRTWRWIGHTLRKPDSDITKQSLEWNPSGNRKRGRPRDTWKRHREKEMRENKKTWPELRKEAQNRTRWRTLVEALCSSGNHRN